MYSLLLITSLLIPSATESSPIEWSSLEFNFGTLREGDPATHKFTFKNTTQDVIFIHEASPSCGCTVAKFSEEVMPGDEGFVSASYDTKGKSGQFRKNVRVKTSHGEFTLILSGNVIKKNSK